MSKMNEKLKFGKMKHLKIARKITLFYGGLFSVSLLIISLFMTFNISAILQSNIRKELDNTISQIESYLKKGASLSDDTLATLISNPYVEATVVDVTRDKVYISHEGGLPSFIRRTEGGVPFKGKEKPIEDENMDQRPPWLDEDHGDMEGYQIHLEKEISSHSMEYILENAKRQKFMLVSSYFEVDGEVYHIEALKLIDTNASFVRGFITKLAFVDLIGILCAFLVGEYISRRMLQPVEAIRRAAERITIEDLSQRIAEDGPDDEMKELTVTFNSMIDRLEGAFQRQNQFISDASHELRTPISVIQGYANLVNRWGKDDPAILQESMDSILSETDHMTGLIRKLLLLAKSDQHRIKVKKEKVSLNEAATELVKEFELLNEHIKVCKQEDDAQVEIWGDADLVKQLLWIHMENAIKYSNDGDEITLRVWQDKKNAYISVSDKGVGIAKEDVPKIFDRFYRVDKSRNKEISGTGLGLSIAKWIVECHDGEIRVESIAGEGTTFIDCFKRYCLEDAKEAFLEKADEAVELVEEKN